MKFVTFGADLKVKYVSFGANTQGQWSVVDYGQNFKIKIVDFGQDFTVQMVDFGEGCGTAGGSIPKTGDTYVPGQYVVPFVDDFLTNQLPAIANKMAAEDEARRIRSKEYENKRKQNLVTQEKKNQRDAKNILKQMYVYELIKVFGTSSCLIKNMGSSKIYDIGNNIGGYKIIRINSDSIILKENESTITIKVGERKNL